MNGFIQNIISTVPSEEDISVYNTFRRNIFYLKSDIPNEKYSEKLVITAEEIENLIFTIFKKRAKNLQPILLSTLHSICRFTLEDKSYYIKINTCGDLYKELHFYTEKIIVESLVPIISPTKIIFIDLSRSRISSDYEIIEEAKGESLYNKQFSLLEEKKIFSHLGTIIGKIHRKKYTTFGDLNINEMFNNKIFKGNYLSWEDFFNIRLHLHNNEAFRYGLVTKDEKAIIDSIFDKYRKITSIKTSVLLHNDLGAHNLFFDNQQISAIIDWEDTILGDPCYEIANFQTFCFRKEHTQRFTFFLEGYKSIQNLPEDFELRCWFYYLRISLIKGIIHCKQENLHSRNNDILRIKKSINHLAVFT